jgi:4-amino-4-deoxy-L-arabinose transferase-like glycosyltransferase
MAATPAHQPTTADAPPRRLDTPTASPLRRLPHWLARLWRSPPDQPPWARPALLAVAALAALTYLWKANATPIEPYYGAAARSMSGSWHDFLFGAFDPAGTVSVDKLPGALWVQALSLRVFGFHVWAIVWPQAMEGVIAVLVLYRVSRRLAGPVAGIAAATLLAVNPATVALNRGNVSDALLVMLTVLAADAAVFALISGRLRSLLLAGVWVGLAFQAKMLQAWLILPALALVYLVVAPPSLRVRVRHVALAGLMCVVVSLGWMGAVSLVPAGERPYVDGSHNDSLFSQVFEYNGFSRIGSSPSAFISGPGEAGEVSAGPAVDVPPGWHRLLSGLYGREIGWLVPAALISAAAILVARRRRGRRDLPRASVLLWGLWALVLWVAFSAGVYLHTYYVAALAPALAGLCGAGVGLAWPQRGRAAVRATLAGAIVVSLGYGIYLLHGGWDVPGWLIPAAACLTALGVLVLLVPAAHVHRASAALAMAAFVCALLIPAAASEFLVARGVGAFAAPFEPMSYTQSPAQAHLALEHSANTVAVLESTYRTPIAFAVDSSRHAAPFILATGKEILPIGGFEGRIPSPTLSRLQRYIATGKLRGIIVPSTSHDPRITWVYQHCHRTKTQSHGSARLVLYDCGN